jgi:hypothetical protein
MVILAPFFLVMKANAAKRSSFSKLGVRCRFDSIPIEDLVIDNDANQKSGEPLVSIDRRNTAKCPHWHAWGSAQAIILHHSADHRREASMQHKSNEGTTW